MGTPTCAPHTFPRRTACRAYARGKGVVVNLSTLAASVPARRAGIYGATKASVELLTQVWADEFGRW